MTNLSDRTIADHANDLRPAEEHVAEARRIVHTQNGCQTRGGQGGRVIGNAVTAAALAGVLAVGGYLWGAAPAGCLALAVIAWSTLLLFFSHNMARAEIGELKMILDREAPGWAERNATWTSTWDWNREIQRQQRWAAKAAKRQQKRDGLRQQTAPERKSGLLSQR